MHGPRAVSLRLTPPPPGFLPTFSTAPSGAVFFFLQGKPLGSCVKARALYRAPARPGASSPSAQSGDALYRRLSADRDADARAAMHDHGDVSAEPRPRSRGHIPRWCGRKRTSPIRAVFRMALRHHDAGSRHKGIHLALGIPVGIEIGGHHETIANRRHPRGAAPNRRGSSVLNRPFSISKMTLASRVERSSVGASQYPCARSASTSGVVRPKMKMLSSPRCSRISTLAPSSVPIVSAPFRASFMLPDAGGLQCPRSRSARTDPQPG